MILNWLKKVRNSSPKEQATYYAAASASLFFYAFLTFTLALSDVSHLETISKEHHVLYQGTVFMQREERGATFVTIANTPSGSRTQKSSITLNPSNPLLEQLPKGRTVLVLAHREGSSRKIISIMDETGHVIVSPNEIYRWAAWRNFMEKIFGGLCIFLGALLALQAWRQFRRFKRQHTST